MSDTPRTDALLASKTEPITAVKEFMRTIERELNIEKSEKMKYRERAWRAESQLDVRYGLRREINAELGLTDEIGDDALRKGIETIKALKDKREWRPIDTAPKNGMSIVIRCSGDRMAIARWVEMRFVGTGWMVLVPVLGGWGSGTDTFIYHKEDQPTHWMPLPEPPKETP